MFQNFIARQMLKSKLSGVSSAEQEKIINILEKNPDFFMKMAGKIQLKTKDGQSNEQAAFEVMQAHRVELQKILS